MSVTDLFRGEHAGVFTGTRGYYAARMAEDGISHYQSSQGYGWSKKALDRANREAQEMEHEATIAEDLS